MICKRCGEDKPHYTGRNYACKDCHNAAGREWYAALGSNGKQWRRMQQVKSNYKLSEYDLWNILDAQDDKCLGCNTAVNEFDNIDHDHKCCPGTKSCGKCVRGILCPKCNKVLGLVDDSRSTLMRLADYLEDDAR